MSAAVLQHQTGFAKRINEFQLPENQPRGQRAVLRWAGAILLGLLLWLMAADSAWAGDGFGLCGEACSELSADVSGEAYFVGYDRGQHLELEGQVLDQPLSRQPQVYAHVSDFSTVEAAPNVDEQQLEAGQKAAMSIHRFNDVKVGFVRKSELLSLSGLPPERQRSGKIKASSAMVWGDTLRISSTRLSEGSPVALQIEREIGGGFEQPATDYANYRLTSQTWVNGRLVPKLDYQLAKYSGPGERDREQGRSKTNVSVLVKVGDAVTVESRLQVQDGLVASDGPQLLDGYDSVTHRLTLLSDDSCATSDSGRLTTGDCD